MMEHLTSTTDLPVVSDINPADLSERIRYSYDQTVLRATRWVDKTRDNIKRILKECGVSERFIDADKGQIHPETWEKIWGLWQKGEGLFLTGNTGVGKTHLSVALMREAILTTRPTIERINMEGTFIFDTRPFPVTIAVPRLFLEIRKVFNRNHTDVSENDVIEKYADASYLFLDDLGVEKPSDWSLQTLYTIIDHRYTGNKQTVITSNLELNDIAERHGDRIASRIAEMCVTKKMTGEDRRILRRRESIA